MPPFFMSDYTRFHHTDFLLDDWFIASVRHPTPETEAFWRAFLAQHPQQAEAVAKARQLVLGLRVTYLPEAEASEADVAQAVAAFQDRIDATPTRHLPWRQRTWQWAAAAVLVGMLSGVGWWAYQRTAGPTPPLAQTGQPAGTSTSGKLAGLAKVGTLPPGWVERHNDQPAAQTVSLPDGSTVTLYTNSTVRYPAAFGKAQREVQLMGQGFFSVTHDPAHPFVVASGEVVTKVLGTSFWVTTRAGNAAVQVVVRTGRVSVFRQADWAARRADGQLPQPGAVLMPNQQAVYLTNEQTFRKSLIDRPQPLPTAAPTPRLLHYDDTPVLTVLRQLEVTYGVPIRYEANALTNCTLTADFADETLQEKVAMLSRTLGGRHEVINGEIHLYVSPCLQVKE
jgi:transmembrane sensor